MIYNKKLGRVVVITIIILNFIVFIVKGLVGLEIGSLALLSDAVHTLSDSASSVAVYLGLKISEKPADEKHPYGHGRADQIAVLAVGLILILAAISFISDGIQSFLRGPDKVIMSTTFYIVIILTAIVKEIMADISYFVGKKIDSDSLKADAWHHRGDAITTVIVLIALFGSEYGYHFLDPIVGVGIALLLVYIGI